PAAHRVGDDVDPGVADLLDQLGKIDDVVGKPVLTAGGPIAIAVTAEVEGVDGVTAGERLSDEVPAAGVVAAAVNEDDGLVRRITPEKVVEAKAGGREVAGFGLRFAHVPSWSSQRPGESLPLTPTLSPRRGSELRGTRAPEGAPLTPTLSPRRGSELRGT